MPPNATAAATKSRAAYFREYRKKKSAENSRLRALEQSRSILAGPSGGIKTAIGWIEDNLKIPSGPLAGQPFKIPEWQRDWLIAASRPGIREAGLDISRKNGKSGLIAAILLAYLVGPLNRYDWHGVVTSLTGPLAKELRDAIYDTAKVSGIDSKITLYKSPTPGKITGLNDSSVLFLAADKASGHAIGADLALIDEAGLLEENKRFLWNAIFSCISGRNGKFWCISIHGHGPMFQELSERAESDKVHYQRWQAPKDCALDDRQAWHKANPALSDNIKALEYMEDACERALASPANEMHFRAYDLNQDVEPGREVIVSVKAYTDCIQLDLPPLRGDVVLGIDLGGSTSMTCAVALCLESRRLFVRGAFPDSPALHIRAKSDGAGTLYDRMIREGDLKLYPGKVTPVVDFLTDFFAELGDCNILVIGCDRARKAEGLTAFENAGLARVPVKWRGTGASAHADGSHDVRAFQRAVLDKRIKIGQCTMLEAAIAGSQLRFDQAGNPALDKAQQKQRIDALQAAVIATGLAELHKEKPIFRSTVI